MARLFSAAISGVAVTVQQDMWEIVAPSTGSVKFWGFEISQSTEAGDAQDEMLGVQVITGYTTSGSGGSSATAVPLSLGGSAFGGTVETSNTTVATTGTAAIRYASAFNVRAPHIWLPEDALRPIVQASERLVVRVSAPADSVTFWGTAWFESLS